MPTWYDPLSVKHKRQMDVLHYKVLRVAVRDWYRSLPNSALDYLGRAKPGIFSSYAVGSVFLNSILNGKPARLLNMMLTNAYTIKRSGQLRFFDSSIRKIGKQSIANRIDDTTKHFELDWVNLKTKDAIRIKKTFFNQN